MKIISVVFLLLISLYAFSDTNLNSWVSVAPENFSGEEVSKDNIYEVAITKESLALEKLSEQPFVEIDEAKARDYVGSHFKRQPSQHTYLIRALNTNPGTGAYMVQCNGNALYVIHGSLGGGGAVNKAALVVNLNETLKKLYIDYTQAM